MKVNKSGQQGQARKTPVKSTVKVKRKKAGKVPQAKTETRTKPNLPNDFVLHPNGRKFITKKIGQLPENHESIPFLRKQLELPGVFAEEQNKKCLPGNGVKIKLNGQNLYVVIDGTALKPARIFEGRTIVSSGSPLGKALLGLEVGDENHYDVPAAEKGKEPVTHYIEVLHIDMPSSAKWVFKLFDEPVFEIAEEIAA